MINNFLIIKCIGKDDKLGLKINKEFFIYNFENNSNKNDKLVSEIYKFLNLHNVKIDENFSVIINQGPGSFSTIRAVFSVAKGLEISKNMSVLHSPFPSLGLGLPFFSIFQVSFSNLISLPSLNLFKIIFSASENNLDI